MASSSPLQNVRSRVAELWQSVAARNPQLADFLCPITSQIMEDPVTAEDNFNYERSAIESWLMMQHVSPQTKKKMGKKLVPNQTLQKAIEDFNKFAHDNLAPAPAQDQVIVWDPHGERCGGEKRSVTVVAAGEERPSKRRCVDHGKASSMAQALSRAFRELDPLRDLLRSVLDGWTPPKIVVIGDESAGKSTILEQLAMLPVFPRKRRFCTRLAIHLRLRRGSTSKASLSVYLQSAEGAETLEGEPKNMPQENGWAWVQDEMMRLVEELSSQHPTGVLTEKMIVLEVERPDVPSIDLVDLPGITTVPQDKAAEVQKILLKQLALDAESGHHSMFLAIVPASGDVRPTTNMAMRFVQEQKLETRTFGVFSKCDQVADADVLRALVLNENANDGDSPEALGAVSLKSWVATMLKPPPGPEFQLHNFERILIQQQEEVAFFATDPELKRLVDKDTAGIQALVKHVERHYSDYLNTTWKAGAMKKVLEKLDEKEFEFKMLGVVEDTQKDNLAKQEVERRMGPDSPAVMDLYSKFIKLVQSELCAEMRSAFSYMSSDFAFEGYELNEELLKVKSRADVIVTKVLEKVQPHWIGPLQDILTAESKIDVDSSTSDMNIVTQGSTGISLRLFKKGQPKKKVLKAIKQQPFIQLSHYKEFTDAILDKCRQVFREAVESLQEDAGLLTARLVDIDSPWLRLTPVLVQDGSDTNASSKVRPSCDVDGFLSALVTLFLRKVPSPQQLRGLHEGVTVGTEKEAALSKHKQLKADMEKIQAARDGIRRALDINDAEFERMQNGLDADA